MINVQNIAMTLFMWGITFLVPAVVWGILFAGLLQLVRDSIRRIGLALPSAKMHSKIGPVAETQH
ncbi:MAG: hypothetical protein JXA89_09990 [Anaerolineae bacterium]|nr:hypothetical protein [Anaerolineae bacterium]